MNKHVRALIVILILVVVGVGATWFVKYKQEVPAVEGAEKAVIELNGFMPDFEAKTLRGDVLRLSQYRGKVVILNFWASWCGPCVEEMPSLIKLVQALPQDVQLIAVSGDSSMIDIESFLKSFPELKALPNVHVIFDEQKVIAQQYQVFRLPESYVLDKAGKMVKKISGIIDWNTEDARLYLSQLIHPLDSAGASSAGGNSDAVMSKEQSKENRKE